MKYLLLILSVLLCGCWEKSQEKYQNIVKNEILELGHVAYAAGVSCGLSHTKEYCENLEKEMVK